MLNAFRDRVEVMDFRQINEVLLKSLIQTALLWEGTVALIDADTNCRVHPLGSSCPVLFSFFFKKAKRIPERP